MKKLVNGFTKFCAFYATCLKYLITILIPVLIITVTYQISARHLAFIPRFLWTEEICRFALNWLVMLGSALAVRNNDHFEIDLFPKLGPRAKQIRFFVINLILLVSVSIFAIYGWGFAVSGQRRRSLAAGLSMFWVYISFMFFGISALLFQIEKFIVHFSKTDHSPQTPSQTAF